MRAVRLFVSGRVQGVGFRYFVAGEARRRGPPGSRVDHVEVMESDGRQLPESFEIRRDG